MGEAKVKSYTRKTKSGKTIQVRAHSRKCEGGSCSRKVSMGEITELEKKIKERNSREKKQKPALYPPQYLKNLRKNKGEEAYKKAVAKNKEWQKKHC